MKRWAILHLAADVALAPASFLVGRPASAQTPVPDPEVTALAKAEAQMKREIWLIDMLGNVVHKWPSWGGKAILLPNGHVFQMQREIDWDGKIVWEFKPPTATHHDGRVLPDRNYLLLCYENVPAEKLKTPGFGDAVLSSQEVCLNLRIVFVDDGNRV